MIVSTLSARTRRLSSRRVSAFTLIELLVVISIIALLLSVMLPALGGARDAAKLTQGLSSGRSIAIAMSIYSNNHKGLAIGNLMDFGFTVRDINGGSVDSGTPEDNRWPLPLLSHAGDEFARDLYIDEPTKASLLAPGNAYGRSLSPSFGLNHHNVGGPSSAHAQTVVRRPETEAVNPSKLLQFVRSNGKSTSGSPAVGYFYVMEYLLGDWPTNRGFLSTDTLGHWGGVSFIYRNRTVAGFCDGHVQSMNIEDLRDQRYWNNESRRLNDPNHFSYD